MRPGRVRHVLVIGASQVGQERITATTVYGAIIIDANSTNACSESRSRRGTQRALPLAFRLPHLVPVTSCVDSRGGPMISENFPQKYL